MPDEPKIKLMPYSKRQRFFYVLAIVFVVLLPAMIFYTTGHRIDFNDSENRIVTTGGVYITTDNLDVDVYLDDEQVRRPRLFRSAYYIQDIESGTHRVVVQQDGLYTWVKELPVDPYIVIEAAAFNMPVTPQLRHITAFTTIENESILPVTASSSSFFTLATTTQTVVFTDRLATSSYLANAEYEFMEILFSTTTASSTSMVERFLDGVEGFGFATTTPLPEEVGTTSVPSITKGNISLLERDGEIYAQWEGSDSNTPYYYCVTNTSLEEIANRYGDHVSQQVEEQDSSTTTEIYIDDNRICRSEIKIDRKRQNVLFYDFLPGSSDLVLLQLEEGLFVSEIDDRAWQNTQQIFAGSDFKVLVENNRIYLKNGDLYAELLTQIP